MENGNGWHVYVNDMGQLRYSALFIGGMIATLGD
jgi:hypothetical protein